MDRVSKWEVAGVPAAAVFAAIYELGLFQSLGLTAEDLPRVMLLCFVIVALIRAYFDRHKTATDDGT